MSQQLYCKLFQHRRPHLIPMNNYVLIARKRAAEDNDMALVKKPDYGIFINKFIKES